MTNRTRLSVVEAAYGQERRSLPKSRLRFAQDCLTCADLVDALWYRRPSRTTKQLGRYVDAFLYLTAKKRELPPPSWYRQAANDMWSSAAKRFERLSREPILVRSAPGAMVMPPMWTFGSPLFSAFGYDSGVADMQCCRTATVIATAVVVVAGTSAGAFASGSHPATNVASTVLLTALLLHGWPALLDV